jgi:hypothetical protein
MTGESGAKIQAALDGLKNWQSSATPGIVSTIEDIRSKIETAWSREDVETLVELRVLTHEDAARERANNEAAAAMEAT